MDITSLYNVSSGAIKEAVQSGTFLTNNKTEGTGENSFEGFLSSAVENLNTTNSYLSDAENEEIKLALGKTGNTHDLTIALQKASTALSYTVAVRDKLLEAYKEIMQIQI